MLMSHHFCYTFLTLYHTIQRVLPCLEDFSGGGLTSAEAVHELIYPGLRLVNPGPPFFVYAMAAVQLGGEHLVTTTVFQLWSEYGVF